MTNEEIRAQLADELDRTQKSAVFWAEQVPVLPDGPLQSAASRTLQSALVASRELKAAIEEIERA